jgi:xanthine dehydrogenase accessory factor
MTQADGGVDVMELAVELSRTGQSFALATVVWRKPPSSGQHGSKAIITADGTLHGWIGGACAEPVVIREAKKVITAGEPALIWLGGDEDFAGMHIPDGVMTVPMSCQSEGALQLYIEPVLASPQVTIVGRSPMVMTLLELVRALGWRGEVVDSTDFSASAIAPSGVVVIATQGHGDEEALEAALAADPAFIGLVASHKRGETVLGFLADRGLTPQQLKRVHVPIGLDLGHTTHREIAVAILAELVQLRATGAFMRQPGNEVPIVEDVIDLVCGMTVAAVPANRPFEYNSHTYYFCAPGCRAAFEKDPDSFIKREVSC